MKRPAESSFDREAKRRSIEEELENETRETMPDIDSGKNNEYRKLSTQNPRKEHNLPRVDDKQTTDIDVETEPEEDEYDSGISSLKEKYIGRAELSTKVSTPLSPKVDEALDDGALDLTVKQGATSEMVPEKSENCSDACESRGVGLTSNDKVPNKPFPSSTSDLNAFQKVGFVTRCNI